MASYGAALSGTPQGVLQLRAEGTVPQAWGASEGGTAWPGWMAASCARAGLWGATAWLEVCGNATQHFRAFYNVTPGLAANYLFPILGLLGEN